MDVHNFIAHLPYIVGIKVYFLECCIKYLRLLFGIYVL